MSDAAGRPELLLGGVIRPGTRSTRSRRDASPSHLWTPILCGLDAVPTACELPSPTTHCHNLALLSCLGCGSRAPANVPAPRTTITPFGLQQPTTTTKQAPRRRGGEGAETPFCHSKAKEKRRRGEKKTADPCGTLQLKEKARVATQ